MSVCVSFFTSEAPLRKGDYVEVIAFREYDYQSRPIPGQSKSLCGMRGRVLSDRVNARNEWKILLDGEKKPRLIGDHALFRFESDDKSFVYHMNCLQPTELEKIASFLPPTPYGVKFSHWAAQEVDSWCSEEMVEDFLASSERQTHMAEYVIIPCFLTLQKWATEQVIPENEDIFRDIAHSNAPFCNLCSSRPDERESALVKVRFVPEEAKADMRGRNFVALTLHQANVILELLYNLLQRPSSDRLLMTLTQHFQDTEYDRRDNALYQLMRFVSASGICFRSTAEKSIRLIALILVQDPFAVLSMDTLNNWTTPDEYFMRNVYAGISLIHYIIGTTPEWHLSCMYKESPPYTVLTDTNKEAWYYAVHSALNLIPLLYYMASWRRCFKHDETNITGNQLLFLVNQLLSIVMHYPIIDRPLDPVKYPGVSRPTSMDVLLSRRDNDESDESIAQRSWRLDLLRNHPASFAAAGLMEVLGWWMLKGYDIHVHHDPADIYTPTRIMSFAVGECIPAFVERHPQLSYILTIATAIVERRAPEPPDKSTYLLYGPLYYAHRRCGLASCRKTAVEAGGSLLHCSGGCEGLQQYCCREHQVADWKAGHKRFCRENGREK